MKIYKVITLLLTYPEQDWLQSIGELRAMVAAETGRGRHAGRRLDLLLLYLERGRLIDLQEAYVETFDRNPAHSLLIFEHTMGESRERGAAMARLVEEYRQAGLEVTSNELPDFLPVFLKFLSLISPEEAQSDWSASKMLWRPCIAGSLMSVLPTLERLDALTTLTPGSALSGVSSPIRSMKRLLRREAVRDPMGVRER